MRGKETVYLKVAVRGVASGEVALGGSGSRVTTVTVGLDPNALRSVQRRLEAGVAGEDDTDAGLASDTGGTTDGGAVATLAG
jgi:hypothetical protein